MIHPARIRPLNDPPSARSARGEHVLYWMQQSQRTRFNHALEYAIQQANQLRLPLLVCFGLTDAYPDANARHYAFMLQGLRDVDRALQKRGIPFIVRRGNPPDVALFLARARDAALIVCDRGYLRHQKRWRDELADNALCPVIEVETDVVVPVDIVSDKPEYAARTIRPKIHKHWADYLKPLRSLKLARSADRPRARGDLDLSDPDRILSSLDIDRTVPPSPHFPGGEVEARRRLRTFIRSTLPGYADRSSDPALAHTSALSPYLHFGQISPIEIALAVRAASAPAADRDSFLEQLIVRRELAVNFCNFNPKYDQYDCLPDWARKTLAQHARDPRPSLYSRAQLERAQTHDPYWNAAQLEMTRTGYMHNSMRMYWGKKILEWKATPQQAYADALHLNNRHFLDGRDPTAYANIAWLFGLHDRPWTPRPIFGTIRYMNAAGLDRKFDMPAYVDRVNRLPH